MEIRDFRPSLERRLGAPAATPAPAAGHLLARFAGRIADALAARRVASRLPAPDTALVVSVGNLRVGGTGKTPVTVALARDLTVRGYRGAVVTRGHGATASGPLVVDPDDPDAADEARLMAAALADRPWTVIQSPRRDVGLALALGLEPAPRVVILEDGHQTARAGRHLDILILDAWSDRDGVVAPATGAVLPFGPYRETAAGAARAGIWLLEDAAPGAGPAGGPTVTGFVRRMDLRPARPDGVMPPPQAAYALLAGLARPEGFEAGCAELLPRAPVLAVRCADHVAYDGALVRRILRAGAASGANTWITTVKDWVKLAGFWPASVPVLLAELRVEWTGRETLPDLVEERLLILGATGAGG